MVRMTNIILNFYKYTTNFENISNYLSTFSCQNVKYRFFTFLKCILVKRAKRVLQFSNESTNIKIIKK